MEATVAREERVGRGGAESPLCDEVPWKRRARAGGGATCTVEETYAQNSAQAAEVRSQRAWCGGDCARKLAGSSAEEEHICVEERAFRARWGVRRAHGGSENPWKQRLRVKSAQGEEALNLHCAKKCRGRDVRVRVEVRRAPWRRRMRAGGGPRTRWGERVGTELRRRKCAVRALGVEEKVIARESA